MALPLRPALLALLVALVAPAFERPLRAQAEVEIPADRPLAVVASLRLGAGQHARRARPAAADEPACVLRVAGLQRAVIDLREVTLRAIADATDEHARSGCALYLTDCTDVTVIGGTLLGFRAGVVAERCSGLVLEGLRVEQFEAARLLGTQEFPDDSDRLVRDVGDGAEWLAAHGAALALLDSPRARVSGCRARAGQNGLLLVRCADARVFDNDFSFLSGWGIALHGSTGSVIARNRCDFCVRGFSAGTYALGQGSAGILLAARSNDAVIAENSARCCGDGVAVLGNSDRALILRNDLSAAVQRGVLVATSRDSRALANVATGCEDCGLLVAGSERTIVADCDVTGARGTGIALYATRESVLARSLIESCALGLGIGPGIPLELWCERPDPSLQGDSSDPFVFGNSFRGNVLDLGIVRTQRIAFGSNIVAEADQQLSVSELFHAEGEPATGTEPRRQLFGLLGRSPSGFARDSTVRVVPDQLDESRAALTLPPELGLPGESRPTISAPRLGLDSIALGEWGPWEPASGSARPAMRPFGGALVRWSGRWFRWEAAQDPRGEPAQQEAWRALAATPAIELDFGALVSPWGGDTLVRESVGEERFGLLARAEVEVEGGAYRLRGVCDDGLRVKVDGRIVLEDWRWQAQRSLEVRLDLAAGPHVFELEYFQIDGAAALALELVR